MIGVDIVSIKRIERFLQKFGGSALERFLSFEEIALCLKLDSIKSMESGLDAEKIKCDIEAFRQLSQRWMSDYSLLESCVHISRVAGFWAAKEACSKALGVGIGQNLGFLDMRISRNQRSAPLLKLSIEKEREFGVGEIALSISHDGGFAIAVVVAMQSKLDL